MNDQSQFPEEAPEQVDSPQDQPEEDFFSEEPKEDEQIFKDGQILDMVRVRFPGNSRSFGFMMGKRKFSYGQKVLAMSDRGIAVGYINSFPYSLTYRNGMPPVKAIQKVADEEDIVKDQESYKRQKQVESLCQDLIVKYQLDMNLTHIEFTQFGKKAVFYFIAPARVDFRELVKELVSHLKMRVELRQITVRDRSASIGGLGPCGRELCCSSFLTKYGNVGVKMAKNQDLTLNFSKLNGVCGQLKCCLQYEDEVYTEKRKRLPKYGELVECHNGDKGRVDRIHILSEQFEMIMPSGIRRRYVVDQFKHPLPELKMPEFFEGIIDETKIVTGLTEQAQEKAKTFEQDMLGIKENAKSFADQIFQDLFGAKTLDASLPEISEGKVTTTVVLKNEEEELPNEKMAEIDLEDLMTEDDAVFDDALEDTQVNFRSSPNNQNNRDQQNQRPPSRDQRGPRDRDNRDNRNQRHHQGRPKQNRSYEGSNRNSKK
jgi:cell fate regulator YaaT (PSP1 superfamily)